MNEFIVLPKHVISADFKKKELVGNNEGWVSAVIRHDTASFALATIRNWWYEMGGGKFSTAKKLLITADGGSRGRYFEFG